MLTAISTKQTYRDLCLYKSFLRGMRLIGENLRSTQNLFEHGKLNRTVYVQNEKLGNMSMSRLDTWMNTLDDDITLRLLLLIDPRD